MTERGSGDDALDPVAASVGSSAERPAPFAPSPLDPAEITELDRRLRAFAQALVGDSALADDLVQDAWLALLRRSSGSPRSKREWLKGAVRLQAIDWWQSLRRREARERRATHRSSEPAAETALEAREVRDVLSAAVERVSEPYRTALRLRFFEGLEIEQIAQRVGAANGTVRSRLSRGMDELRRQLDQRFGDRARWCVLLAPRLNPPTGRSAVRSTSLSRAWLYAAIPLALLTLVAVFDRLGSQEEFSARATPEEAGPTSEANPRRAGGAELASERREAPVVPANVEAPQPGASEARAPDEVEPPIAHLVVRVVDSQDAPVGNATVELIGPAGSRFVSSPTDTVEIDVLKSERTAAFGEDHVQVRAFGPGEAASATAFVPLRSADEPIRLATTGPACVLRIAVNDPSGAGVAGARVQVNPAGRQGFQTADNGVRLIHNSVQAHTDASGVAEFAHTPRTIRRIRVEAEGWVAAGLEVDTSAPEKDVAIQLDPGGVLFGRVLLPDGSPAIDASVALRFAQSRGKSFEQLPATRTAADGTFTLRTLPREPYVVLAELEDAADATLLAWTIAEPSGEQPITWNPTLAPYHDVVVALVDEHGAPRPSAKLVLTASLGPARRPAYLMIEFTDSEGRARFRALPGVAHSLLFERGPNDVPTVATDIHPPSEAGMVRTVVVQRSNESSGARIVGTLLENDGAPAQRARVRVCRSNEISFATPDPLTGRFEHGGLIAGEYEVLAIVEGRGAVRFGTHHLAAGEQLDLGVRRMAMTTEVRVIGRIRELGDVAAPWSVCAAPEQGVGAVATVAVLESLDATVSLLPGEYHLAQNQVRSPSFTVTESAESLTLVVGP